MRIERGPPSPWVFALHGWEGASSKTATAVSVAKVNTGCQSQAWVDLKGGQPGEGHHLCALQPLCLSAWRSGVAAPMQVPLPACLHALSPRQPPRGFQCSGTASRHDTAQQKVLHLRPTALPGTEAAQPPLMSLLDEQKAQSQDLHREHHMLGATRITQCCPSLVCSGPTPCCVCPGLQEEAAQRMLAGQSALLRQANVASKEEDTC